MELQAELVHAEPGRRVVRVSAHQGSRPLGSALGEGEDAEAAEDRARERLLGRLGGPPPMGSPLARPLEPRMEPPPRMAPAGVASPAGQTQAVPRQGVLSPGLPPQRGSRAAVPRQLAVPPPQGEPPPFAEPPPEEPPPEALSTEALSPEEPPLEELPLEELPPEPPMDPEDWSQELLQLDLQLQRLGWSRDQEGVYLQRAFGHPSRSRLTRWADLTTFLRALEGLAPGQDPATAPTPLLRSDLLQQCDTLLQRLGWDTGMARRFLEHNLAVSSRQQLSDAQLLQFNMLLEESWLAAEPLKSVCEPGFAPAPMTAPATPSSPQRS